MLGLLGATKKFELFEELLDLCHIKGTVKGDDILREVKHTLIKFDLSEDKICGITTDGTAALTCRNKGFVSLFKNSIGHDLISYHCIIHQQQLCAKVLEMTEVLTFVADISNFIHARGLNHRQLKNLMLTMRMLSISLMLCGSVGKPH